MTLSQTTTDVKNGFLYILIGLLSCCRLVHYYNFYIALLYLVRLSGLIPIPCSGSVDRVKWSLPLQAMTIISDPESMLAVTSHSLSMIDVSARLHRE